MSPRLWSRKMRTIWSIIEIVSSIRRKIRIFSGADGAFLISERVRDEHKNHIEIDLTIDPVGLYPEIYS